MGLTLTEKLIATSLLEGEMKRGERIGGGIGMLSIGVGGFDGAMTMAGEPLYIIMPKIVNVHLTGKLTPFVSAKNIILEVLRRISIKGGVGKILEYTGPGVATLNVAET